MSAPIPRLSGRLPLLGHLLQLRREPICLMQRCREECGEVGEIMLAGQPVVMLYGEPAQEAFFRAPDEELDQAAAYPFMKPIFGPGVVFDATPEQRKQALRNRSLRDQAMRGHAESIARETERMVAGWGDSGTIDLLEFFAELTIYTSSGALIGPDFREELDGTLVPLFADLERGTDPMAYVNPYLPLPSFRKRDRARRHMVAYLQAIFERRERDARQCQDLFQILRGISNTDGSPRYDVNTIAGMFISLMFAGHHTTSTTSSWRSSSCSATPSGWRACARSSTHCTRTSAGELPGAPRDPAAGESLQGDPAHPSAAHPPDAQGRRAAVRLQRLVDPGRHERGGARSRCRTVTLRSSVIRRASIRRATSATTAPPTSTCSVDPVRRRPAPLRRRAVRDDAGEGDLLDPAPALRLRAAQPSDTYHEDHSKMVVQLKQPCRVRYRRRH